MNVNNDEIEEAEVWLDCFKAILSNENTLNIDTAAELADKASDKFWVRYEDTV